MTDTRIVVVEFKLQGSKPMNKQLLGYVMSAIYCCLDDVKLTADDLKRVQVFVQRHWNILVPSEDINTVHRQIQRQYKSSPGYKSREQLEIEDEMYCRMQTQFINSPAGELAMTDDLMTRRILRANRSLSKRTAAKLTAVIHDVIRRVREYYAVFETVFGNPREEEDIVETLLRFILKPVDDEAASKSWRSMEILSLDIDEELYARFLFVSDIINGHDTFTECYPELIGKDMASWGRLIHRLPP
jgi:hypothetical protein